MATPKIQNAYRDATNQTADIADLLLVTTSGLATDADAGASYLVYHNGSNDVLASSAAPFPVTISGISTASLQTSGNASLTAIAASVAGTLTVASHAVTNAGTFAVQAAQSGTWNVTNISGTVSLPTGASTAANQATEIASLASIDGKTPALGQALAAASVPIVLTAAQLSTLTPPAAISGFATLAEQQTQTASLSVMDDWDESDRAKVNLIVGQAGITAAAGAVAANTPRVTLGSDDPAVVALQLLDNVVQTGTLTKPMLMIGGWSEDLTAYHEFTTTDDGRQLVSASGTVTSLVTFNDGADPASTNQGNVGNGTQRVVLAANVALPAGTNAIGKLTSNTGVTIGAVEIAASQTLGTVTTVTTCSTVTTLTGGGIAHDGVDSGNPIKTGSRVALTLSDDTMVANADRADNVGDGDGTLLVRNQFPLADLVSETITNTNGTSTAFSNFGATASTRNVITAIVAYNSSATAGTIDFRDGTAGSVLYTVPIPAGGGCILPAGATPYFKTTANTALAYDVSGALTTVTISISGFKSKVT